VSGAVRSPRSAASGGATDWAPSTAVTAGQLLFHDGALYRVRVAHTTPALFSRLNLRRLTPERALGKRGQVLPFERDTRILDPAASTAGLGAMMFVQPEQIVRDTNGDLYCATTYTKTDASTVLGWLRCLAANDPRDGANWAEAGAITGLPLSYDAPCAFKFGSSYYIWAGGKATGLGVRLYKSDAGVNGTYSLVGAGDFIGVGVAAINAPTAPTLTAATTGGLLPSGTYSYRVSALTANGETDASTAATVAVTGPTGAVTVSWAAPTGVTNGYKVYGRTAGGEQLLATIPQGTLSYVDTGFAQPNGALPIRNNSGWRINRVTEPAYFRRKNGTHVLLVMGFDAGNTREQVGMFTCPATASNAAFETPANWTASPNNPVIPCGPAGSDDEQVSADPTVLEFNGTAWILTCGGAAGAVAAAVVQPQMLTTTTDWATFTKRGPLFEGTPLWPTDPAPNTQNGKGRLGPNWRGHFFQLGPEWDNDVLWPYGANYGSFSGNIRQVQARMAVIPQKAFLELPSTTPEWVRVQSDAVDSRLTRTGAGWTLHTNVVHNGGTAYFSATAGDRIGLYFDGTGVRVRGQCRNNLGTFNVWLDGVKVASDVDAYQIGDTTNNYWGVLLAELTDLPAGQHYIEIEVTGNKNAASSGASVFVDAFEYLP
jgi:hypothetical protein